MIARGGEADEGEAGGDGRPRLIGRTATPVALVTGASRGIGAEVARLLGAAGVHVLVNYREKVKRANAVVDGIRAAGGQASAAGADVCDGAQVEALLTGIGERFDALDVLVLNASGGLERGLSS